MLMMQSRHVMVMTMTAIGSEWSSLAAGDREAIAETIATIGVAMAAAVWVGADHQLNAHSTVSW